MPRFGTTARKIGGTVAVAALIAGGASYYYFTTSNGPSPREVAFTDVALTTESGEPIDISSFTNAPVVVVSWATWCPSCIDALAVASRAKEKHAGLEVLAVNRKEEQMIVDDYREAYDMPSGITYARDDIDQYFKNIIGTSMPEVLVYDSSGGLVAHLLAPPTDDELAHILNPLYSE